MTFKWNHRPFTSLTVQTRFQWKFPAIWRVQVEIICLLRRPWYGCRSIYQALSWPFSPNASQNASKWPCILNSWWSHTHCQPVAEVIPLKCEDVGKCPALSNRSTSQWWPLNSGSCSIIMGVGGLRQCLLAFVAKGCSGYWGCLVPSEDAWTEQSVTRLQRVQALRIDLLLAC